MYSKLVPLNIPGGWAIVHNAFGDEDPFIQHGGIVNSHFYNENLLLIRPIEFEGTDAGDAVAGYHLKLGWYPHANPHGCYRLIVENVGAKGPIFQYESRKRQAVRQTIERCLNLMTQGVKAENIEAEIQGDRKSLEKNPRIFSGTRKRIFDEELLEKKNRLTYSQVSLHWPVYYEVSNIIYLEPKSNKMENDPIAHDHKKL